mmetsp:Transcript_9856/g.37138  ORF Transcript_9856/g.37138 Transcript_9856/m.37138 type:complete len:280 (-) Transcript_9856:572-1411(-)
MLRDLRASEREERIPRELDESARGQHGKEGLHLRSLELPAELQLVTGLVLLRDVFDADLEVREGDTQASPVGVELLQATRLVAEIRVPERHIRVMQRLAHGLDLVAIATVQDAHAFFEELDALRLERLAILLHVKAVRLARAERGLFGAAGRAGLLHDRHLRSLELRQRGIGRGGCHAGDLGHVLLLRHLLHRSQRSQQLRVLRLQLPRGVQQALHLRSLPLAAADRLLALTLVAFPELLLGGCVAVGVALRSGVSLGLVAHAAQRGGVVAVLRKGRIL